jgi:predicted MFS family arabinose efflux permease
VNGDLAPDDSRAGIGSESDAGKVDPSSVTDIGASRRNTGGPAAATRGRDLSTLGLLLAVGSLSILDRSIVNVLAQDIKSDLRISDSQLGLLTGTSFGVLYALLGLPLGRIADRVNRFHLIAAAVAVWSAFTALCGLAGSYTQLFAARAGVAIGEAGSSPASVALVTEIFPANRRASAMSVMLLGGSIGSFLGLLVGGLVGGHWGWRTAFLAAGLPGFVVSAVILAFMRDPSPPGQRTTIAAGASWPAALRALLAGRRFVWLAIGHTCTTFMVYAGGAWLPAIFIRNHGMSTAQIGGYAAFAVGFGGALGTLGGGLACDLLRGRGRRPELKLLATTLGLSLITLLATILIPDRSTALAAMFLFNGFVFSYLAPSATLIQGEANSANRGFAQAICLSLSVILNLGAGLPLVGLLSDYLHPQFGPIALSYALGIGSTAMVTIGLFAYWRVRRLPALSMGEFGA